MVLSERLLKKALTGQSINEMDWRDFEPNRDDHEEEIVVLMGPKPFFGIKFG